MTPMGHLILGIVVLWSFFIAHLIGVHIYGRLVVALSVLIFLAAATIACYGFGTDPATFVQLASTQAHLTLQAPASPPPASFAAFVSVTFLFIAAYGGLTGAPALGGEARNASKTIPQGLLLGWGAAIVLYTVVTAALFHAVPWWATLGLINGKAAGLATAPGLISVVAPKIVGIVLNFAVAVIVGKTAIPQMMVASRLIFGFAQDHVMPTCFLHTSRWKTPDRALLLSAGMATLFLVQSCFGGWAIGIVIRSFTVLLMLAFVALAALNVCFNRRFHDVSWANGMRHGPMIVVMAVASIVIALYLLYGGLIVPNTIWYLQPLFQGAVAACVAGLILLRAQARARANGFVLTQVATNLPLE